MLNTYASNTKSINRMQDRISRLLSEKMNLETKLVEQKTDLGIKILQLEAENAKLKQSLLSMTTSKRGFAKVVVANFDGTTGEPGI